MFTIDMQLRYLAPIGEGEDAIAEGWVVQRGRQIVFCEAEVRAATARSPRPARSSTRCRRSRRSTDMVTSKAATVPEYLAELPDDRRAAIEAVRDVILEHLPAGTRR